MRRDTRQRIEQYSKNPDCRANVRAAVLGVDMAIVAAREGVAPSSGQSPFAISRGESFERSLLKDEAARLRTALATASVLPTERAAFIDLRTTRHGGPQRNQDTAAEATRALLHDVAAGTLCTVDEPLVVAGAAVVIADGVLLPSAMLVVDVLVVVRDERGARVVVGEVKSYPDRAGYTDPAELAGARAQAGFYVHALATAIAAGGLRDRVTIDSHGFLVLTKPGSGFPSVRAGEALELQARRAARAFTLLQREAAALPVLVDDNARTESVATAPTAWREACLSFCDRAPACHARALTSGDPAVLGEAARRVFGATSLNRAADLCAGRVPARSPAEQDLLARLDAKPRGAR